jgi:hypothetical protein
MATRFYAALPLEGSHGLTEVSHLLAKLRGRPGEVRAMARVRRVLPTAGRGEELCQDVVELNLVNRFRDIAP